MTCEICQNKAGLEAVLATQKRVKEIREMPDEEFKKLRKRMEQQSNRRRTGAK
jgi:hypothetical protein